MMRALAALLVALGACAHAADQAPAQGGPQVFLVQNSGWMEPFYSDPDSPFKPLVGALVTAATQPGDPIVLAAFNQSLPDAPSPKALLSARVGAASASSTTITAAMRTAPHESRPDARCQTARRRFSCGRVPC